MYTAKKNFPTVSEFMGNQFLVTFLSILQAASVLLHTKKLFFMVQLNTFLTGLIGVILCMTLYIPVSYGQCPTPENTAVSLSGQETFKSKEGQIIFIFHDGQTPDVYDYRVRLYNRTSSRFMYDDHHLPVQNTVPHPIIENATVKFTGLPEGDYILLLQGGECKQQVYEVSGNQ